MSKSIPHALTDYTLTRQEVEYLKRSNTCRSSMRLDRQTICDDPASPSSESDAPQENVFHIQFADFTIARCRYMQVKGSSEKERRESLLMNLRNIRLWQRMNPHPSVVDIQGYDVKELVGNTDSESIHHFRLISNCSSSTISEYLVTHPQADRNKLCIDIAAGLDHIHCNAIIHGAIRPSNILIRPSGTACLGEFSDERVPGSHTLSLFGSYLAPELFDIERLYKIGLDNYRASSYEGEYKMESDIFALGTCMLQIYTGVPPDPVRIPYDKVHTHQELARLRREPAPKEKASIPAKTLSTILVMTNYIPHFRVNSSVVCSWLENPDSLRLRSTLPVLAKRKVWSAFREMVRMTPSS